jgi:hypothetical protein
MANQVLPTPPFPDATAIMLRLLAIGAGRGNWVGTDVMGMPH